VYMSASAVGIQSTCMDVLRLGQGKCAVHAADGKRHLKRPALAVWSWSPLGPPLGVRSPQPTTRNLESAVLSPQAILLVPYSFLAAPPPLLNAQFGTIFASDVEIQELDLSFAGETT
jgi:hypothetical protein